MSKKQTKSEFKEQIASDGRRYFYNPKTGVSQWKNPDDETKPDSYFWKKCKDSEGNLFYYNSRTKESTWTRPSDYDIKIEKQQETEFRRQNFFKMMSSSVQKDLNPIQYNSPSIFTLKEASARFDTDPRLIHVTEAQRERFFDEWVNLERKRRVELEKGMVANAKRRLKDSMFERVDADLFSIDTKWQEICEQYKHNTDWRILLNFDRFQIFKEVKETIHNEIVDTFNQDREVQMKNEAERRISFLNAIKAFIDASDVPLQEMTFSMFAEQIREMPEYIEMKENANGSTPADLFYDVIEEKMQELDQKVSQIKITEEDFDFSTFCSNHEGIISELNENDKRYAYESSIRDYLLRKEFNIKKAQEKEDALLQVIKLDPTLVQCPSFEQAKDRLKNKPEFNDIETEEEQQEIYSKFVKWSKNRNCEPGEIIKGDDDWIDIGPIIENELKKRGLEQLQHS